MAMRPWARPHAVLCCAVPPHAYIVLPRLLPVQLKLCACNKPLAQGMLPVLAGASMCLCVLLLP